MAMNHTGADAFAAAKGKAAKFADENLTVEQDQNRAEKLDPGRDASADNVARAKREGWSNSGGGAN